MNCGNSSNCVHWLYAVRTSTSTSMDVSSVLICAPLHEPWQRAGTRVEVFLHAPMRNMWRMNHADGDNNGGAAYALSIADVAYRTGIPVATLRAWETRYGFPAPERL